MEKMPYPIEPGTVKQQGAVVNSFERDYSELVDLAVHDLDAPLRKLTVLVDMLTGKLAGDTETVSYVQRIAGCIGNMRSLIDDLAVLAKMSVQENDFVLCNIEEVIQQALQDLPEAIKDRKAVVTLRSLPSFEADGQLMRLLFKHLIENAIKFNKSNEPPRISIQSSAIAAKDKKDFGLNGDKQYYKLEVIDNGIGFKNQYADKIFQPFVRLHGKAHYSGNGIGLAICRKIVELHRGTIYAESRENEESRFIIILPESH